LRGRNIEWDEQAVREASSLPAHEALQLRYLQTLTQIAGENSSTMVFPLPLDVTSVLKKLLA